MSSRQLAAILFSDLVGYTELMGKDSEAALKLVKKTMSSQKPIVEKHGGKWLKEMGDGVLVQFNSALDAVQCAIDIQRMARVDLDAQLRIGIHLGDVTMENDDVFGDGVNVASRLETLCDPGGIYISESVKKAISGSNIESVPMNEVELKGVSYSVKPYAIQGSGMPEPEQIPQDLKYGFPSIKKNQIYWTIALFGLIGLGYWISIQIAGPRFTEMATTAQTEVSDKSIAVLPFEDMSPEGDQAYFSEGISEEIMLNLFKIGDLKIPSRTSMNPYRGASFIPTEVGRDLNVSYVLEGSVRKNADRIIITTQLVSTEDGAILWAEKYDQNLSDIFKIQADVAFNIANSLSLSLNPAQKRSMDKIPTNNLIAYDLYLKAKHLVMFEYKMDQAQELLIKAVALDSTFADAYALMANDWIFKGLFNGSASGDEIIPKADSLLEIAFNYDSNLPEYYLFKAFIDHWFYWDFESSLKNWDQYFSLNPSNPTWPHLYTDILLESGNTQDALTFAEKSYTINQYDPSACYAVLWSNYYSGNDDRVNELMQDIQMDDDILWLINKGKILTLDGNYEQAIPFLEKANKTNTEGERFPWASSYLAYCYYQNNQIEKYQVLIDYLNSAQEKTSVGSPSYFKGVLFALMGKNQKAIENLQIALQKKEVELVWLKVDPPFENLRKTPEVQEIISKVGIP